MRLDFTILFLLAASNLAFSLDCKNIVIDSRKFDLSSPPKTTFFKFHPCNNIPTHENVESGDECTADAIVCAIQVHSKGGSRMVTEVKELKAANSGVVKMEWSADSSDAKKGILTLHYPTLENDTAKVDMLFECDPSANETAFEPKVQTYNSTNLQLYVKNPKFCPTTINPEQPSPPTTTSTATAAPTESGTPTPPSKPEGDTKQPQSGPGFFSIVFQIILYSFLAYFVIGILYKRFVLNARGIEQIPHHEFWREVPGMCMDLAERGWRACTRRDRGYVQM
ncbi:autophagy-related protein 27 [Paraphysoderma sedebokerense]|nr:autophagy-related protein 27 [Paraphysoderma sedebokerense]